MTSPSDPLAQFSPEQQRAMLAELLRRKATAAQKEPASEASASVANASQEHLFPMSAGQQGLWYAYCRDPHATPFNVYLPTRLRSAIDVDALRRSIECLADRHSCLRTTFLDRDGELLQCVHAELKPEFKIVDLETGANALRLMGQDLGTGANALRLMGQDLGTGANALRLMGQGTGANALRLMGQGTGANALRLIAKETQRPFNLQTGPLLRLAVYRVAADDFIILATTHHIVVDFWSLILMLSELREVYPKFAAGAAVQLPLPTNNYEIFVNEQRKMLASDEGERLQRFWREQLGDTPTLLELVTDYERPVAFTGRAAVVSLNLPPNLLTQVQQLASSSRTTAFTVVHAALQVMLSRYSGQREFLIGSPFSGRGHRKFETTVGFFVNMLPIRSDLTGNPSFAELISRTSRTLTDALEHEDYPLSSIVHDLAPPRDPSRSPLFQVSCTYEKSQLRAELGRASFLFPEEETQVMNFGGLRQESFYIPHQTCHYDLEFIFEQTDRELRGMICYCRDLFSSDSMQAMAENFSQLISDLVHNPQRPIFTTARGPEPTLSLATQTLDQPQTVTRMLDRAIEAFHDRCAMRLGTRNWTYRELGEAIRKRVASLPASDNGRQEMIPVIGPAAPETLITVLAVMASGAAVVPIDESQPAVSRRDLIEDTQARTVLEFPFLINANQDTHFTAPEQQEDQLAYVIYTSGSTGRPKGVMIEHRAICNTLQWRQRAVTLSTDDRVLIMLSHQFDAGLGIMLTTLTQGAELVWLDPEARHDFAKLVEQLIRDKITVLPAIPSVLRALIEHPRFAECVHLRQLWAGGESMPRDLPSLVRQRTRAILWNFYGPTEAAVEATALQVQDHDVRSLVSIGYPIDGAQVVVLDEFLQPVADTVPGELAIAGRGLARGYLNQPDRTAEQFIELQQNGRQPLRVYRTGDRGRKLRDGRIEFLGRIDHQVKLRGYRIELEEIEQQLKSHPLVANAAVILHGQDTPRAQLIGYISLQDADLLKSQITTTQNVATQIRAELSSRLPAYKVPTQLIVLAAIPTTTSGKVNRGQLPEPTLSDSIQEFTPPSTPLEQFLAKAWCDSLGLEQVSVNQDFFELGGSSLQAAVLTAKLTSELGVHVPTSLLFDLANVSKIARRLVQLYEVQIAEKFGMNSVTAYAASRGESSSDGDAEDAGATRHPLIAPFKTSGNRTPIFLVHPPGGIVMCYRELAARVDRQLPVYAIRSRGLHGREKLPVSVEEAAADYVMAMKSIQPHGPYRIGGWSLGGIFALEMALQLTAHGERVERLMLLDTSVPEGSAMSVPEPDRVNVGLEYGVNYTLTELRDLHPDEQLPFLWEHAKTLGVLHDETPPEVIAQVLNDLKSLFHLHMELTTRYTPGWFEGEITLIRPKDVPFELKVSEDRGWRCLARSVNVHFVGGHHHSMVQMPHVIDLADLIAR